MIKLVSSSALALSVAVALFAAPAQANGTLTISNTQFGVISPTDYSNHSFTQTTAERTQATRRAKTGYTAQPQNFADNEWHQRPTGHLDSTLGPVLDLSRIGRR